MVPVGLMNVATINSPPSAFKKQVSPSVWISFLLYIVLNKTFLVTNKMFSRYSPSDNFSHNRKLTPLHNTMMMMNSKPVSTMRGGGQKATMTMVTLLLTALPL
jgi:hypothetical protein